MGWAGYLKFGTWAVLAPLEARVGEMVNAQTNKWAVVLNGLETTNNNPSLQALALR
jgi:hypothetical protein